MCVLDKIKQDAALLHSIVIAFQLAGFDREEAITFSIEYCTILAEAKEFDLSIGA